MLLLLMVVFNNKYSIPLSKLNLQPEIPPSELCFYGLDLCSRAGRGRSDPDSFEGTQSSITFFSSVLDSVPDPQRPAWLHSPLSEV